jgi:hypothetical protein
MSSKKISSAPKKEFKKELTDKMGSALPEIKAKLGEKKFNKRVKKAAKILTQGLHSKDFQNNNGAAYNGTDASSKKIKIAKKAKAEENELPSA